MTRIGEFPIQVAHFLTSPGGQGTPEEVQQALLGPVALAPEDWGLDRRLDVTQEEIERLSACLAMLKGRAMPHLVKCRGRAGSSAEADNDQQRLDERACAYRYAFAAG
jgi:hypothetical protein